MYYINILYTCICMLYRINIKFSNDIGSDTLVMIIIISRVQNINTLKTWWHISRSFVYDQHVAISNVEPFRKDPLVIPEWLLNISLSNVYICTDSITH